jgi:hypothetical protein
MNNYFILQLQNPSTFQIFFEENKNILIENCLKKYNKISNEMYHFKKKVDEEDLSNFKMNMKHCLKIFYQNYNFTIFFDYENSGALFAKDIHKSIEESFIFKEVSTFYKSRDRNNIHDSDSKKKYPEIFLSMDSNKVHQKLKKYSSPEKIFIQFETQLKVMYQLYRFLDINGIFYFKNYYFNQYNYEMIYLLGLLFKYVILDTKNHLMCIGFLGEQYVSRELFKKIIENYNTFHVEPKPQLVDILNFIINDQKMKKTQIKYEKDGKFDKVISITYKHVLKSIYEVSSTSPFIQNIIQNFQEFFQYQKSSLFISNLFYKIDSFKIKILKKKLKILDKNMKEVFILGMSYGSLPVSIMKTYKKSKLFIIDPYQESIWDNHGLEYIEKEKILKKRYQFTESDIIHNLKNLQLGNKKYTCIIMNLNEPFEKLSSYLIYLHQLSKKKTILIVNGFSTEYLKLNEHILRMYPSYLPLYNDKINHQFYVYQL